MGRVILTAVVCLSCQLVARADFHLWKITEVFTNGAGNVQFVELGDQTLDGEHVLAGHVISSSVATFTFETNLPSAATVGSSVLLGTADFAALENAPAPDYIIPPNFFMPVGDTINYAGVDSFSFADVELPNDGVRSLARDRSTPTNSPTNFAGFSGSVNANQPVIPLPSALPAAAMTFAVLLPLLPGVKKRLLERSREFLGLHQR